MGKRTEAVIVILPTVGPRAKIVTGCFSADEAKVQLVATEVTTSQEFRNEVCAETRRGFASFVLVLHWLLVVAQMAMLTVHVRTTTTNACTSMVHCTFL